MVQEQALSIHVFPGQNQTEPGGSDGQQPGVGVYAMDKMVIDGGPSPQAKPSGPYFDPENSGNVSVITGAKAMLNCRVFNIGNRTVSADWEQIILQLCDISILQIPNGKISSSDKTSETSFNS